MALERFAVPVGSSTTCPDDMPTELSCDFTRGRQRQRLPAGMAEGSTVRMVYFLAIGAFHIVYGCLNDSVCIERRLCGRSVSDLKFPVVYFS